MKLPNKIIELINEEAIKNASFSWYSGWEQSSGYIKSELRQNLNYGTCRIYIKWEKKKKPPTDKQINEHIKEHILSLLANEEHPSVQRDFRHYVQCRFFTDMLRLKHEAMLSLTDNIDQLIKILEAPLVDFSDQGIATLHNDLKNLQCALDDQNALETFLEKTRQKKEWES